MIVKVMKSEQFEAIQWTGDNKEEVEEFYNERLTKKENGDLYVYQNYVVALNGWLIKSGNMRY